MNTERQTGQKWVGKRFGHPLSSAFVRFGRYERPLTSGWDHSYSFAYIRFRSLPFAYNFFIYETEGRNCPTFAKPMVGRRKFLPGGDERWHAPECVTANSPEYVTLEGLIHRDSSQYVTKKIMCATLTTDEHRCTQMEKTRIDTRRTRGTRGTGNQGRMNRMGSGLTTTVENHCSPLNARCPLRAGGAQTRRRTRTTRLPPLPRRLWWTGRQGDGGQAGGQGGPKTRRIDNGQGMTHVSAHGTA